MNHQLIYIQSIRHIILWKDKINFYNLVMNENGVRNLSGNKRKSGKNIKKVLHRKKAYATM